MNESVQYPSARWLVLIAAIFGYMALQITNLSFAPILPDIARDLGVDMGTATSLMTAFLFAAAIGLPFAGALCDKSGVVVVIALSLFFISVPAALLPIVGKTYASVLVIRIFEGFSMSFILSVMGPIVALWFPLKEKGLASGILGTSISVGSAIGLMVSPIVLNKTGNWQQMAAWLSIFGWVGLAFTVMLFLLLKSQPLSLVRDQPGSESNVGSLKKAIFSPVTWIGILVFFCAQWCLQGLLGLVPTFLAAAKPIGAGFGDLASGQFMMAAMAAGVVGPILGGILTDKVFHGGSKQVLVIGYAISFLFIYFIKTPFTYTNAPLLIAALALAGLGVQIVNPAIWVYVSKIYPPQIIGKISGLWMCIGLFGGALVLLAGGMAVKSCSNYDLAIMLIALGGLIGFLFSFLLSNPKAR